MTPTRWIWPLLISAFFSLPAAASDDGWVLREDRNGIVVHTRQEPGSPHWRYRGIGYADRPVEQVVMMMRDLDHLEDWLDKAYDTAMVREIDARTRLVYMKIETPAIPDRDLIVSQQFEQVGAREFRVYLRGYPDELPAQDGLVRIPYYDGFWHLTAEGERTRIEYQGQLDPGGWLVPTFVTNLLVSDVPYNSIRKIAAYPYGPYLVDLGFLKQ